MFKQILIAAALFALAGCETMAPAPKTPLPPDPKTQMAALETRIAVLVEEQRQKLEPKAKALAIDPQLARIARARSAFPVTVRTSVGRSRAASVTISIFRLVRATSASRMSPIRRGTPEAMLNAAPAGSDSPCFSAAT